MKRLVLLAVMLGVLSCGKGGPLDERGPLEEPRTHPNQARIVCDEEGTTVETPVVVARADGVHLLVINRTNGDPGFSFRYGRLGGGRNLEPADATEFVESIAPGEAEVGCGVPGNTELDLPEFEPIRVVDPDAHYRSLELHCTSDEFLGSSGGAPGAGTTSDRAELVGAARESWAARLADGDVVEVGGYPESPDDTYVRVVRQGRVVAYASYLWDFGEWSDNGYNACGDF